MSKPDPDPEFRRKKIRIRIRNKSFRIRNPAFNNLALIQSDRQSLAMIKVVRSRFGRLAVHPRIHKALVSLKISL